jgi:hypothetical protein
MSHDNGSELVLTMQSRNQIEDPFGGGGVEVARRLVGQKQLRACD